MVPLHLVSIRGELVKIHFIELLMFVKGGLYQDQTLLPSMGGIDPLVDIFFYTLGESIGVNVIVIVLKLLTSTYHNTFLVNLG